MELLFNMLNLGIIILVFTLITYIVYKKLFRGFLFTDELENKVIDAAEKFKKNDK